MIIAGVAVLAGVCWLGWVSVQSLLQARLLARPVPLAQRRRYAGRAVALCGAVRVEHPVRSPMGHVLWYEARYEERRGWGRRRHWVTVAHETHSAQFWLEAGDQRVWIADEPTEVQGTESKSETDSWFLPTSRVTYHWLPILEQATVLGKLECSAGADQIVRDRWAGLLISPGSPESAARWELLKGWAGLLLAVAALAATAWFFAFGPEIRI